jgi:hypothetical protein
MKGNEEDRRKRFSPIEVVRNYCGMIRIARCGFPWEKTTKRPVASRISCAEHSLRASCAAFFTESRMQFGGANKLYRKSGFGLHQLRNCRTPLVAASWT